jgi:ankyrin repeat protein
MRTCIRVKIFKMPVRPYILYRFFSQVVCVLLEANANVEDHNKNDLTPLMEAASAGHCSVACILLMFGAGINTHSSEFKESALTLACYKVATLTAYQYPL